MFYAFIFSLLLLGLENSCDALERLHERTRQHIGWIDDLFILEKWNWSSLYVFPSGLWLMRRSARVVSIFEMRISFGVRLGALLYKGFWRASTGLREILREGEGGGLQEGQRPYVNASVYLVGWHSPHNTERPLCQKREELTHVPYQIDEKEYFV